jgi:hypothetical protein
MWTKSLVDTITDTRGHLHEELGFMIQVEAQTMKTLTDTIQQGLKAKIAEVEALAMCGLSENRNQCRHGSDP